MCACWLGAQRAARERRRERRAAGVQVRLTRLRGSPYVWGVRGIVGDEELFLCVCKTGSELHSKANPNRKMIEFKGRGKNKKKIVEGERS